MPGVIWFRNPWGPTQVQNPAPVADGNASGDKYDEGTSFPANNAYFFDISQIMTDFMTPFKSSWQQLQQYLGQISPISHDWDLLWIVSWKFSTKAVVTQILTPQNLNCNTYESFSRSAKKQHPDWPSDWRRNLPSTMDRSRLKAQWNLASNW
jgi:hypothetical protein